MTSHALPPAQLTRLRLPHALVALAALLPAASLPTLVATATDPPPACAGAGDAALHPTHVPRFLGGEVLLLRMDCHDHGPSLSSPWLYRSKDASPARNDAVLQGPYMLNERALFGNGYELFCGGTCGLRAPDAPSLRPVGPMTVMVWFKSEDNGGQRGLLHKYFTDPAGYFLEIDGARNRLWGGYVVDGVLVTAAGPLPAENEWTHAALVWDGAFVRLHLDGAEFARTPASGVLTQSGAPLQVGRSGEALDSFLGVLDEARVYARALTGAEIADIARDPVAAVLPPAADVGDGVPDALEPTVCRIEDQNTPLDGRCVGNDYDPPV